MNKQANGENKMGSMPIGRLLITMSAPMMGSMLFQALYNIVDSIFVAKLSQDAMNAVSLAFPLQTLCIAFGAGTGVGINAVLSKALGEKDQEKVDRSANTGIFLYIITAIVFMLIGILFGKTYYKLQTANEKIISYGSSYVAICLGLSFMLFGQLCFERLLQSTGRTDLAMIPQICGACFNMIFDPILIFGLFGFPRMEVAGAALATVCGQFIALVIGITLNVKKNKEIHLSFKMIRFHKETAKEIYRIGVPSIIMQAIGSVMNFGLNKILIGFTEAATAAFGAYYKIQSFIFLPVLGMNSAIVPIVAFNYGAKRMDRVKQTMKLGVMIAVCIMTFGCILFETIPGTLLKLFSPSDEMLAVGKVAFRTIGIHFPLAGFCIVAGSICQALGKPVYSMINSICRQMLIILPVAYFLSLTGKLDAVWWCFPIAELSSVVLSAIFVKKTITLRDNETAVSAEVK